MQICFLEIKYKGLPLAWEYDESTNTARCLYKLGNSPRFYDKELFLQSLSKIPEVTITQDMAIIEDVETFSKTYSWVQANTLPQTPQALKIPGIVDKQNFFPASPRTPKDKSVSFALLPDATSPINSPRVSATLHYADSPRSCSSSSSTSPRAVAPVSMSKSTHTTRSFPSLNLPNYSNSPHVFSSSSAPNITRPLLNSDVFPMVPASTDSSDDDVEIKNGIWLNTLFPKTKNADYNRWSHIRGHEGHFQKETKISVSKPQFVYSADKLILKLQYEKNMQLYPIKSEQVRLIRHLFDDILAPIYENIHGDQAAPPKLIAFLQEAIEDVMIDSRHNLGPTIYEQMSPEEKDKEFGIDEAEFKDAIYEARRGRAALMLRKICFFIKGIELSSVDKELKDCRLIQISSDPKELAFEKIHTLFKNYECKQAIILLGNRLFHVVINTPTSFALIKLENDPHKLSEKEIKTLLNNRHAVISFDEKLFFADAGSYLVQEIKLTEHNKIDFDKLKSLCHLPYKLSNIETMQLIASVTNRSSQKIQELRANANNYDEFQNLQAQFIQPHKLASMNELRLITDIMGGKQLKQELYLLKHCAQKDTIDINHIIKELELLIISSGEIEYKFDQLIKQTKELIQQKAECIVTSKGEKFFSFFYQIQLVLNRLLQEGKIDKKDKKKHVTDLSSIVATAIKTAIIQIKNDRQFFSLDTKKQFSTADKDFYLSDKLKTEFNKNFYGDLCTTLSTKKLAKADKPNEEELIAIIKDTLFHFLFTQLEARQPLEKATIIKPSLQPNFCS